MKVTVVNQKKGKKKKKKSYYTSPYLSSIVLLVLGIVLLFRSKEVVSMVFSVIGLLVLLYGIYKFVQYQKAKEVVDFFNESYLYVSVVCFVLGLICILFSNFFATMIQIISGIWLIFVGLQKLEDASMIKDTHSSLFITDVIVGFVIIALGVYTLLADNVVFMFIGIAMICYSLLDIYQTWKQK